MSRELIDREAALKEICLDCHKPLPQYPEHGCPDPCYVYGGVSNLPAVDAVCVVRCKNCKHMNLNDESCEQCDDIHEECGVCMYSWNCVSFDDFCSYGERRSE